MLGLHFGGKLIIDQIGKMAHGKEKSRSTPRDLPFPDHDWYNHGMAVVGV